MRSTQRIRKWLRLVVAGLAATAGAGLAAPVHGASDPLTSRQWGLDLIQARAAWSTGRGAGVTIAVVDSGADLGHEDLAANLVAGRSLVGASPQDDDGHGTHVSGIAAGVGNNGVGISGAAPEAKIMPVKVLTPDGGTVNDVATGIRHAADAGAAVINLSLGPDVPLVFSSVDSTFSDAIRYAWSKGSICVLAAGNNALPVSDYGNLPAIVVTAVDRHDRRAGYATAVGGARWGLAAPGGAGNGNQDDDVLSTYWTGSASNSYAYLRGTSMAAPFVSGAAAVLRGLGLSPQATVDKLLATAVDIGPSGRDSTFGSGRLDMARAVSGLGPKGAASGGSGSGSPAAGSSPQATSSAARPASGPRTTRPPAKPAAAPAATAPDGDTLVAEAPESTLPDLSRRRVASEPGSDASTESANRAPLVAGGFVAVMTAGTAALWAWRSRRSIG